jgi:hypothetical protein
MLLQQWILCMAVQLFTIFFDVNATLKDLGSTLNQNDDHEQCGNTTTFCTNDSICCTSQYSPTNYGCKHIQRNNSDCCKPGPPLEPSTVIPNCLVIGDSVSIGYTPIVAQLLNSTCQVQHGPYDNNDGGALDTSYGLQCLDNFLVTQRQTPVIWDVIVFNFGLHNLINTDEAKQSYKRELLEISLQLSLRMPFSKLIYATTTPYMKDLLHNNTIVENLNDMAIHLFQEHFPTSIDIADLHKVITDHW